MNRRSVRSGPLKSRRLGSAAGEHRSGNKKKITKTVVPRVHSAEDADAKFYMFTYKVVDGPRRPVAIRNGVYNYGAIKCPKLFNRVGRCPLGNKCRYAHNSLEILYHPLVYKTRPCNKLSSCEQGQSCAWAHSESDMRRLVTILGRGWRSLDAVSADERKILRIKQEEKEGKRNIRVSLGQRKTRTSPTVERMGKDDRDVEVRSSRNMSSSEYSTSLRGSTPRMSMSMTPSRSRTPARSMVRSPAVSVMSESEREPTTSAEEKYYSGVETIGNDSRNGREGRRREQSKESELFEWWYRNAFDCDVVDCAYYLGRFQSTNLDDLDLLWGLFELGEKSSKGSSLVDLLMNEIGMVDEISRDFFLRRLCEYKCPVYVNGWLDRVVGLPQYVKLFSSLGADARVSDLIYLGFDEDDLAEMGISLAGHRAKILYYLSKA